MSLTRQLTKSVLGRLLPPSALMLHGQRARKPALALTFDDGPHPIETPRLLDALSRFSLRATFFVVGNSAQQHPQIVKEIVARGHELGNHTWTHGEPNQTSTATFLKEVARTRDYLENLTGRPINLVRPPKGNLSLGKFWGLRRRNETIVLWNVDPQDFRAKEPIGLGPWISRYCPSTGDMLLFHDRLGFATDILPRLVDRMRPIGLQAVCVSEWLRPNAEFLPVSAGSSSHAVSRDPVAAPSCSPTASQSIGHATLETTLETALR